MGKNISLLLGAGFSAPKGYPIGNGLNELLLKSNKDNFAFSSGGSLAVSIDGSKPNFGYKMEKPLKLITLLRFKLTTCAGVN